MVGPDGEPLAGAEVTCVFTANLFAVGDTDVVTAVVDARGRARCDLVVGKLYLAWAIGPADAEGVRCVSEPVALVAAGRVIFRWFPDASQDLWADLPLPERDELTLPPSPWAVGSLGVRDAAGEVMVATRIEPFGSDRCELAPPMPVHAVVRDDRGEPLADAKVEYGVGLVMSWGDFTVMSSSSRPSLRYAPSSHCTWKAAEHRSQTRWTACSGPDHAGRRHCARSACCAVAA